MSTTTHLMHRATALGLLAGACAVLLSGHARANMVPGPCVDGAPPYALGDDAQAHRLNSTMAVLEDPQGALTLADMRRQDVAERFESTANKPPHYGLTRSAYWLRVCLQGGPQDQEWLLELAYAHHDYVDLYVIRQPDRVEHRQAGERFPFNHREVRNRNFIFRLAIRAHEVLTVYVRVQSESAMLLDLGLWHPEALTARDHQEQLLHGLYFGFLIAILLYNLLLWVLVRDHSYLLFVLFVCALGVMEMALNGLAFEYLWPNNPWWAKQCMAFLFGFAPFWAMLFTQRLLSTRTRAPTLHRVLWAFAGLCVMSMIVSLVAGYSVALRVGAAVGLSAPVAAFVTGFFCWRRGYPFARYFLIALSLLMVGLAIYTLKSFFILPNNLVTQYGLNLGSALLTLLFTMMLGERINAMERDKVRAQQEALEAQRVARERVEALNAELERRVALRTAELESKNNELAILNTRKDELVATVSHDFRSPLAIIRQNVQTLLRDLVNMDRDDQRDFLQAIERQETRLSSMCNQLLDLARLKQRGVTHEPVNMAQLAEHMVDGFRMRARSAGITLTTEIEPRTPTTVAGDAQKLSQLLQNLVDNAVKFTPSGGRVRVLLRSGEPGPVPTLVVQVQDSGCGIPADSLTRIFEPFYQVPRSTTGPQQGSGLGLAIVAEVVKAHGGTVEAQSKEGQGTTFTVVLDAVQSSEPMNVAVSGG